MQVFSSKGTQDEWEQASLMKPYFFAWLDDRLFEIEAR